MLILVLSFYDWIHGFIITCVSVMVNGELSHFVDFQLFLIQIW